MAWEEFRQLLSGLGPDTPLGRIVAIRSETDKETLKHFTKEQRRIRNEWTQRRAKSVTPKQTEDVIEQLRTAFLDMAGIGG